MMSDLIDRQQAIDALEYESLGDPVCEERARDIIRDLPTAQPEHPIVDIAKATMAMAKKADMVAVTRCKDCAKREYCRTSTAWAVAPGDDWYCADAERRTDEQVQGL